jgi:hypothetical protein
MFTHWLLERVPSSQWQQMASDIEALGKSKLATNETGVVRSDLPASFKVLGPANGGVPGIISPLEDGRIGVHVSYEGSNRRWGLAVGPEDYLKSLFGNPYNNWSKFRLTRVATNALLFIGSDR